MLHNLDTNIKAFQCCEETHVLIHFTSPQRSITHQKQEPLKAYKRLSCNLSSSIVCIFNVAKSLKPSMFTRNLSTKTLKLMIKALSVDVGVSSPF